MFKVPSVAECGASQQHSAATATTTARPPAAGRCTVRQA